MMKTMFLPLLPVALLAACGGGGASGTVVVPPAPAPTPGPTPTPPAEPGEMVDPRAVGLPLTGAISPVHDPAILKDGDRYSLFATGHVGTAEGLLPMRTSTDLIDWTYHGAAYPALPAWAEAAVPGTRGIWAPDIAKTGDEYRLYYSLSTFGENRSAIGLATTTSLDPDDPSAGWVDKGPVIASSPGDDFNAIDPNLFIDAEGRHWMAFGSFGSGIKMVRIDPATGLRSGEDDTIHSLASRPSPTAVEAPFVIRHDGYHYLFVSFDFCCRGSDSSYNTVVGRSIAPTGPYLDRDGTPMMEGGGTPVLSSGQGSDSRFVGRGHVAVLQEEGRDSIVYHAYDRERNGAPTLRIQRIRWDADGWPIAE